MVCILTGLVCCSSIARLSPSAACLPLRQGNAGLTESGKARRGRLDGVRRCLIVCFVIGMFVFFAVGNAFAKEGVSSSILFDRLYYSTTDSFTAKISLFNESEEPIRNAKITLKIKRPPTQKARYKSKTLFVRTWSYTLNKKKATLTLNRRIRSLGLKEGAYPVTLTVKKGKRVLSTVDSHLVVVNARSTPPLMLVLVWDLGSQVCFNPQGVFIDDRIQKDLNKNSKRPGSYWQHFGALREHPQTKVNMNITPVVLEQVDEMKDGYKLKKGGRTRKISSNTSQAKNAREMIVNLEELIKGGQIELVPAPYSYPSIPFLASRDWDKDALFQIERGRKVVREVVDLSQETKGFYPPGLVLDSENLAYLTGSQISYTILDQSLFNNLYRVRGDIYSSYQVQNSHGSRITAFFRDDYASEVVVGKDHRMMRVQKLLGRCAFAYLSSKRQRLLVVVADGRRIDKKFLTSLYKSLEETPWVTTATFPEAKEEYPPSNEVYTLTHTETEDYDTDYSNRLRVARQKLNLFVSVVPQPNSLKTRLVKNLLVAESSIWTNRGEDPKVGLSFVEDVRSRAEAELEKIVLMKSGIVTLAGRTGKIPIGIENKADYEMKVTIKVEGEGVDFPEGKQKIVVLHPRENLFTFPVDVKRDTSTPVKVYVGSKDKVIRQGTLVLKTASASKEVIYLVGAVLVLGVGILISLRLRGAKKKRISSRER